MTEYTLTAAQPLMGYAREFGDVSLTAPDALAIVAVALPLGAEENAKKAIRSAYGAALPDIGRMALSRDEKTTLMRLGSDLAFVLFSCETPDAEARVAGKLGDAAYVTDQTDVWCALKIDGPGSRAALERICMLDLHADAFTDGAVARTVMEHLGVIIARTGTDSFLLLSASSSAKSFLHAIETSVENIA